MSKPLTALFVDCDSYFASVEQHLDPALRGRPVGVAPVMAESSCCIAASYEAKAFGVKTATRISDARILCPGIAIVESKPSEYIRFHHQIIAAVEDCIHVEAVLSIDEMWAWLPYKLREPATVEAIGRRIKETVTREVSPVIKVSVGAAPNKYLAKMASKMRKPDGLFIIEHHELPQVLHPLKLRDFTGIARSMETRLHAGGIHTVAGLCAASKPMLRRVWGGVLGVGPRTIDWCKLVTRSIVKEGAGSGVNPDGSNSPLPPALTLRRGDTMIGGVNLLQKIMSAAENKAVEKAWQAGRMCCPNCGGSPAQPPTGADSMVHCGGCGYQALPMDWIPQRNGVLTGHADRVPPNTRIRREGGTQGDCVWHIPASGRFGFFLFFGSFWLAITALVSGGFVMAALQGKSDAPWFIYPFFAVFWAVGIGCIYAAVRNKFARHQLIVTDGTVTLRRELLGRTKAKSLPVAEVTKVEQTVFYQQNYQPIYGVEIRGRRGKLRFGTTLSEAEKAWLVADIRRAVFGEPCPQAPAAASEPEAVIAMKAGLRQSSFSFPLPPASKAGWVFGVILVLIGTVALAMAFGAGPDWPSDDRNAPWFVQVFEAIFMLGRLIPLIVGLIFGGIGVLLIYNIVSGRGRDVRLEGDELQVVLRTYRHGRVMKEQAYPRESVREARATRCGAINERVMKRIDLIVDDKAKRVTHWTEGGAADTWVAAVNEALGV